MSKCSSSTKVGFSPISSSPKNTDVSIKPPNMANLQMSTSCFFSQLVLTGNFFQLPLWVDKAKPVQYAFNTCMWKETIKDAVILTTVYRQKDPVHSANNEKLNILNN
ncbi:hypothetical protein PM082_019222 [Marasmius tenuissimus]|nr:hypothetical protein PM082_019222 [Marasmius tenuissimus]